MIVKLAGEISELYQRTAVVDVRGVGYGVLISNDLIDKLEIGSQASIYVYEHIREQEHTLYGFEKREDQQLFESLLSVNGVGPKAALAIFDLGAAERLRVEIASGNVAFLKQATGIGKKAAERVIVDLKDKISKSVVLGSSMFSSSTTDDEAVAGLIVLGYSNDQARTMIANVSADSTEERIRLALRNGI